MSIEDTILALTGYKVTKAYSAPGKAASGKDITKDNFGTEVLSHVQGQITLIMTKKEHSVKDLKPNYAYPAGLASTSSSQVNGNLSE